MGDQHRVDTDRSKLDDQRAAPAPTRETDDAQFDASHAKTQHAFHAKRTTEDNSMNPVHTVEAVGTPDQVDGLRKRFDDAVKANNAGTVMAVALDMDTMRRQEIAGRLDELAGFLTPRQIITIAGLAQAGIAPTLLAMLAAKPAVKREEIRAYLTDANSYHLSEAFQNAELVKQLRDRFPASPLELMPQLGDDGGLHNEALVKWLVETTSQKLLARAMLAIPPFYIEWQILTLDAMGDAGWKWLDSVDKHMAAAANPDVLAKYREVAAKHSTESRGADAPTVDDAAHVKQLEKAEATAKKEAARTAGEKRGDLASLRARRAAVIAKSSVQELLEEMEPAGLPVAEQLDWLLDKPGLTAAQLREATLVMDTAMLAMPSALVTKLQKKFAKVPVEELFTGEVPSTLVYFGTFDEAIAKWLLAGAEPEGILRIVASKPDLIDEWCAMLVQIGVGFGWVRQLGGNFNDRYLRRLVLKVPDEPTREYIQTRLLGTGPAIAHDTVAAPVAAPTAYTSNRSHLDSDLDTAAKNPVRSDAAKENRADTIAADVHELSATEMEGLRRDPKRLSQVLSTASKKTFAEVLDHVQPELQVVIAYATPANVTQAHLASWVQTRPAREVATTLSTPSLVERLRAIVDVAGPLELLPVAGNADVLGPALAKNPAIMEWLLASEPAKVLRALAAPSVIDAAVKAMASLDDLTPIENWPSAEALGTPGRAVLVQLAARAKGDLKKALDDRLKAKIPKDDDDERTAADRDQQTLHGTGKAISRLDDLLGQDSPAATVLALCRETPNLWLEVANTKDMPARLQTALGLAPDTVFPQAKLPAMLAHPELHEWILTTTPAFKILDAFDPKLDAVAVQLLDNRTPGRKAFVDGVPRGRGLSPANKATLHRIAKLASDRTAEDLFAVTFDTPVDGFPRPDLEKLWSLLERVPHAHVDQHTIKAFRGNTGATDNSTPGIYYPDSQDIKLQTGLAGKKTAEYDYYSRMTEDQAITALGSRDELNRFVAETRMTKNDDGTYSWVKQDKLDLFETTVLHEVGHSVDYMLNAKTELVYGLAGWKRFNTNDFDGWATTLGGWDKVVEADKKAIKTVWVSWINGGGKGKVADMVDFDHPAVAAKYAGVGVVDLATQSIMYDMTPINGLFASAQHKTQEFFTIGERGYFAAPTAYALTAPEEWFAECYANYYREFDGTPATAKDKGKNLAPWIKTWFDGNVDKTGHNPRR